MEVTGSQCLFDSSKLSFRFRAIRDLQPDRVRAIFLARDYRAVVHSKMKRGQSLEGSAIAWGRTMAQIDALTADLPANRTYRLNYETLCAQPQEEPGRICSFLRLAFNSAMLRRSTQDSHHIGGSPSKFDVSRQDITLDTASQIAFRPDVLVKLRSLVGDIADTWDYRSQASQKAIEPFQRRRIPLTRKMRT